MAKQKLNNVRLGLFVVVASIFFIIGVYLIGANKNLFGSNFMISTILTNAGGLQVGNNVRYAGINVGTVEGISIITDSSLQVDLKLVNRVKPFIRKDAVATITVDGIVGSALVSIIPGSGLEAEIEEGDILKAANLPGTGDLMTTLGNTNHNIALFVRDLLDISAKIKDGPGTVSRLLQDSIMATDISQTMKNLSRATNNMLRVVQKLETSVNQIQSERGLVNQLIHDTIVMTNLQHLTTDLNESITTKLDTIIQSLEISGKNISEATQEFNHLIKDVRNGDGTINELIYDAEMAQTIQRTLQNLESGTAKFDEDMEALKHNFLFRGYFRKQERRRKKDSLTNNP